MEYDDLEKIVDFLTQAEKRADEKMAAIQYSKSKIQLAKADYERKLQGKQNVSGAFSKVFPARVIMLSDTLETPTLDNLWNYLSHFYDKITPGLKEKFTFEDLAGIYTEQDVSRLFAVCIRYAETEGLKTLPEGRYLCADCTEETREKVVKELLQKAKDEYQVEPEFVIQIIVISGILQWNYQVQVYLGA